jgi:hypothetical protein
VTLKVRLVWCGVCGGGEPIGTQPNQIIKENEKKREEKKERRTELAVAMEEEKKRRPDSDDVTALCAILNLKRSEAKKLNSSNTKRSEGDIERRSSRFSDRFRRSEFRG